MHDRSDHELWKEAAAGSDAAFAALFERHASSVYNYCFRRLGDWAAAEDLMAATFLEAWRKRDEVRLARDSLRPWLLGVATNLMRNHARSNRRRDAALQRVKIEMRDDGFADDVAERLDDERRMKRVLRMLSAMPAADQEVITLVIWSGLTYDEAALALRLPVGTIKSRLSRARRRLMELASNDGHNNDEDIALARASAAQPRGVEG